MQAHANTMSIAFAGTRRIAAGLLGPVAVKAKKFADRGDAVLILDQATSEPIEVDLRGTVQDVRKRLSVQARRQERVRVSNHLATRGKAVLKFGAGRALNADASSVAEQKPEEPALHIDAAAKNSEQAAKAGPGRPKLGVVAREVTLLPRHWEWLNSQPGGASVALRKLVDEARKLKSGEDRVRVAQESAYRFMQLVAGNLPGFQEAARQLFAGDAEKFSARIAKWPKDVRDHAAKLAEGAFAKRA
jgi:uncharacterized protein